MEISHRSTCLIFKGSKISNTGRLLKPALAFECRNRSLSHILKSGEETLWRLLFGHIADTQDSRKEQSFVFELSGG
ncbi:hypothetical protein NECAME_09739 [Necator americanus]|uniref:Uncharacterized protein n=1 Tax=Necator americanus TaxID=51031 RepID=W2TCM2_NECAM|nr:hypothetical protein NECAME_09739 [Necator americanus]ETN79598.1 hypothetical protein NECAME_09739 [Necator americanus]